MKGTIKMKNITAKHRLKDLNQYLQSSRSRSETSLVRGFLILLVFFLYKTINILFTAYSILKIYM